jgi:hypothetical protein
MNTEMSEEEKTFMKIVLGFSGGFTLIFISLLGAGKVFDFVEDSIKYNRYNEAVQEYRQCAQKYENEYAANTYCGDAPSSAMMI